MKAETLMNLPVIGVAADAKAPARALVLRWRLGWTLPCALLAAAILAGVTYTKLAQINAELDAVTAQLQSPQFTKF